jgi:hypothetical protein
MTLRENDGDNLAAKIRKSWKVIKWARTVRVMPNKVAARSNRWERLAHTHTQDTKIIKHAISKKQMKMEAFLWLVIFSLSPSAAALPLPFGCLEFLDCEMVIRREPTERLSNSHTHKKSRSRRLRNAHGNADCGTGLCAHTCAFQSFIRLNSNICVTIYYGT